MNELNCCSICGATLPSSLETYGDIRFPVCLSCHLWSGDTEDEYIPMFAVTRDDEGNLITVMSEEWIAVEQQMKEWLAS